MSALFFTPAQKAARVAQVQPLIKSIYDAAWKMTESAVFAPEPNLHKSVMAERNAGFDASGYALAASVNDTPPALKPEVAEAVLHAAFAQELPGQHCHMLEALSVPSLLATTRYGKGIATGLSAVAAYAMPYRVDGTPADTPEGLKMFQSESWPCQGSVDFGRLADDCDGQANLANQFIEQAKGLKASGVDMRCFPNLRAVANSIGAHYVHGHGGDRGERGARRRGRPHEDDHRRPRDHDAAAQDDVRGGDAARRQGQDRRAARRRPAV